jgi:hypothetical protein
MKKPIFFFVCFCMSIWGFAQTTSPEVVGSAGDHFSNTNAQISWTLGEIRTETLVNGSTQLTQGFHQVTLAVTAIDDLKEDLKVRVFPNPVTDLLNVEYLDATQRMGLKLFDVSGKQLQGQASFFQTTTIDFSTYAKGTYYLQLTDLQGNPIKSFNILKIN